MYGLIVKYSEKGFWRYRRDQNQHAKNMYNCVIIVFKHSGVLLKLRSTLAASSTPPKAGLTGNTLESPKPFHSPAPSTPVKQEKTPTTGSILNLNLGKPPSVDLCFL